MFFRPGLWLLAFLFSDLALAEDKPLQLLSSIKPVQLIVAAIAGDRAQVDVLLPATTSPHLYQLRPSDRQALSDADKVFWIGPLSGQAFGAVGIG
jgi:zinc transport system substrate-binding protein